MPPATGRAEGWWRTTLPEARRMPVPCSYNDVLVDPDVHDHVGDVWYQRTVFVPRGWAGQRVVLRFDAATHRATAWIGDTRVGEHEGGYTPFDVDVTGWSVPGEEFRLTVVVNNELTWQSIPPGIVEVLPDGTRRQRQYHDFFNYAGLHRSVWLYTTPPAHIADLTVVDGHRGGAGLVHYSAVRPTPVQPASVSAPRCRRGPRSLPPTGPRANSAWRRRSSGGPGAGTSTTSRPN